MTLFFKGHFVFLREKNKPNKNAVIYFCATPLGILTKKLCDNTQNMALLLQE